MTEYVATRWYRAPEVILSWKRYAKPRKLSFTKKKKKKKNKKKKKKKKMIPILMQIP